MEKLETYTRCSGVYDEEHRNKNVLMRVKGEF